MIQHKMIKWLILQLLASNLHASSSMYATTLKEPKAITVTEDSVTDTSLFLTWDAVPKADSYSIYVDPPTIGVSGDGAGITDRFSRLTGLNPNTEYTIRVMAVKDGVEGLPGVAWQKTALAAPGDIQAVPETLTSNSMQVGWTEVDKAESYVLDISPKIQREDGPIYKTSTTLRGLTANTQYTITVRPKNWVGMGGSVTLRQYTKLPSPDNVKPIGATISYNQVSVQWDPVNGADSYMIQVDPPSSNIEGAGEGIMDTLTTIRGLEADSQYTINVMAVNSAGPSMPSSLIIQTQSICYAKAMDFLDKERFQITCPSGCGKFSDLLFGTITYTDDSYICAAAIHDGRIDDTLGGLVTVEKLNHASEQFIGTLKNKLQSKTYMAYSKSFRFALDKPAGLGLKAGTLTDTKAGIEWEWVRGADLFGVRIREENAPISDFIELEALDNFAALSGLKPDTKYILNVFAQKSVETGGQKSSEEAELIFVTALPPPKNIRVLPASLRPNSFTLQWDKVDGARTYSVAIRELPDGDTFVYDSEREILELTGLSSGTQVEIQIRATNPVGRGGIGSLNVWTELETPRDTSISEVTSNAMKVQWTDVQGAEYYKVFIEPCCARVSADTEIRESEVWLENLMPNTKYNITLYSYNEGDKSEAVFILGQTALPAPLQFKIDEHGHDSFKLSWGDIIGATSYQLNVRYPNGTNHATYTIPITEHAVLVKELNPDTEYAFYLNGYNDVGSGAQGKVVDKTLISPPNGLIVQADPDYPDIVQINWAYNPDISKYRIEADPSEGVVGTGDIVVENERETSAVLTGLETGTMYNISVTAVRYQEVGAPAQISFTTALPPPSRIWILPEKIQPYQMDIEWTGVEKADSYEVTYNNLETEHVRTLTGIIETRATLLDLEPASRYQIYVVSVQDKKLENGESETFASYTGEPIHGITQIDSPSMVRVIKSGIENGTVTVMWEKVEKANEYRVGIIPRGTVLGTGKYNGTDLEATLTELDPAKEYKVYVIAQNTERGLVSAKRMSQPVALNPTLYRATGKGPDSPDGQVVLKGVGTGSGGPVLDLGDFRELLEGSGDDEEISEGQVEGLQSHWVAIIIIGAVLLFILLCLIVPCVIECRKCKSEGHFCCLPFGSSKSEEDEEIHQNSKSSLERQKAQMAGYA